MHLDTTNQPLHHIQKKILFPRHHLGLEMPCELQLDPFLPGIPRGYDIGLSQDDAHARPHSSFVSPWLLYLSSYSPDRGPLHTRGRETVTITPHTLSLVEKAEPVQVRVLHTTLEGPTEYVNARWM